MKIAENTRERFLCGKDLNQLETPFVETSINVSLSLITSKAQLNTNILILSVPARDARPAPPRPRGKWLPRAAPAPKIFNSAPPHPGKRGRCPAPPRKLPRGKNRGKRSYIIKSFWESKTFDQYF